MWRERLNYVVAWLVGLTAVCTTLYAITEIYAHYRTYRASQEASEE